MKHTIQLNESDIRNMVRNALYECYNKDINEGRFARAVGTAALGGMLALGGGHLNAKPTNNSPAYTQTTSPSNQVQKVDFSRLIGEWAWCGDDEFTGEYELVYKTTLDAKTMYENFIEQRKGITVLPNSNFNEKEEGGLYKITINEIRSDKQYAIYTIWLKDGAFKITAKLSDKLLPTIPNFGKMWDGCRSHTKTTIEQIANCLIQEKDFRSEFDFE